MHYNFYLDTNLAHPNSQNTITTTTSLHPTTTVSLRHFQCVRFQYQHCRTYCTVELLLFSAHSLSICFKFNGNLTVNCVVHFYDMLHLFGKAKHILYNIPHPLSPDLSTSIKISSYFFSSSPFLLPYFHIVALVFHFCNSPLCVFTSKFCWWAIWLSLLSSTLHFTALDSTNEHLVLKPNLTPITLSKLNKNQKKQQQNKLVR